MKKLVIFVIFIFSNISFSQQKDTIFILLDERVNIELFDGGN